LIMLKDRTLGVPEHLSSWWLCFEFLLQRRCCVLPLHALVFAF
jgi:hypothetical protein